jgi:ribosomal protein S18 acetylase RimI-like enzyme
MRTPAQRAPGKPAARKRAPAKQAAAKRAAAQHAAAKRAGADHATSKRGFGRARADSPAVKVRPARIRDLDAVIAIDATVTGLEKRDYWGSLFRRYAGTREAGRRFLVAEVGGGHVVGFVIGEVRDWEFGSPPCGWVFGIDVRPDVRLEGVGTRLLDAICASFRQAGVRTVRTMLSRDNTLILSFFRSQGMMAGPFIPLEMELAE